MQTSAMTGRRPLPQALPAKVLCEFCIAPAVSPQDSLCWGWRTALVISVYGTQSGTVLIGSVGHCA